MNNQTVAAQLTELFVVTGQNSDTACGHYYAEDDWNIKGYGETLKDAILDYLRKAYSNEEYYQDYWSASTAQFLIYDNRRFEIPETEKGVPEVTYRAARFELKEIEDTLRREKEDRLKAKKEASAQEYLRNKEEQERKQFEELKKKFCP